LVSYLPYLKKNLMKSIKIYLALMAFSLTIVSCEVRSSTHVKASKSKPMPPGQAKKVFGTKSAKPFAPGQNK